MSRPGVLRILARIPIAFALLVGSAVPVTGGEGDVTIVVAVSSPTVVTDGRVVAFPVTVQNTSGHALNHITVTGAMQNLDGTPASGFTLLEIVPATGCSTDTASCSIDQLAATDPPINLVFYFRAPDTVANQAGDPYDFKVTAIVSEGANDNANAANQDTFEDLSRTLVRLETDDFISGHAYTGGGAADLTFSTGSDTSLANPHGTTVAVKRNTEVTVTDVAAEGLQTCKDLVASCFGWGSKLDVGQDFPGDVAESFPDGIVVTMRWDSSQLPKGMTSRKINVIHVLDDGTAEFVPRTICPPNPTLAEMPCYLKLPYDVAKNRGIEAIMLWDQNGIGRGW